MKRISLIIATLMAVLMFSACNAGTWSADETFETDDEIYMFSAVSAASLLGSGQTALVQPLGMVLAEATEPLVEEEIDEINKYLAMMEKYLASANGLAVTKTESDRPEYEHKLVFTAVDMLGDPVEYVLYYNESATEATLTALLPTAETVTTSETEEEETTETEETEAGETEDTEAPETTESEEDEEEFTEEDEDDEEEYEEDDDEDEFEESESYLSGILLIHSKEYAVTGKQEIEDDETKITITSWIDSDNYVFVESKIEDGERKFYYEVVENGEVVSASELKIEVEDDEMKFELEFVSGATEGKYEFKLETEGDEEILKIEYEINDGTVTESGEIKISINVDETTGETTYSYYIETEDEKSSVIEKDRDDDDEDDDDDDDEDDDEFEG